MPEYQNISTLIKILKECLEEDGDILFAYLYGSSVFHPDLYGKDIGIAVYLKTSDIKSYVRKEEELTTLLILKLHTDQIDLRILNVLPLIIQHRILKDGVLIFSRDDLGRVDFETEVMVRYFEIKPYLNEYIQILTQRIRGELNENCSYPPNVF